MQNGNSQQKLATSFARTVRFHQKEKTKPMSKQQGKTFWDFVSENKVFSIVFSMLLVASIIFLLTKNNVEFKGVKITPREETKEENLDNKNQPPVKSSNKSKETKIESKLPKTPETVESQKEENNSILLVLDADQHDAKILVNGKTATVLSPIGTYTEIEIGELNKEYFFQIKNDKYDCKTSKKVTKNLQTIHPCEQN